MAFVKMTKRNFGGYHGNKEKKSLPESRTYTVDDIAAILNIGRTAAYQLVKEGRFRSIRIGNSIRVLKLSFEEWLENAEL